MRTRWMDGLAVVMLSACTRDNPAYDGGGSDTGGATTMASAATTRATTIDGGSVDDDGPPTSTNPGDTTVDVSGTSSSGSSDGPGSSGLADTGPVCVPSFEPPYGIVADPALDAIFGPCSNMEGLTISATRQTTDTSVEGTLCNGNCDCGEDPISLSFDVPLPSLEGCFDLFILFRPASCDVAAYMIVVDDEPQSVVSNVLYPPLPFSFGLAEEPTITCGEGCDPLSGQYAVVSSFDGTEVPPDGLPVPYLEDFEVWNHGSGIDQECHEVGRWYVLPAR